MKKTKFEKRCERAVEAFFAAGDDIKGETRLARSRDARLAATEAKFDERGELIVRFLKRAFIFLPGAMYLFFGSMFAFSLDFFGRNPFAIAAFLSIGGTMTMFGLGRLRNPKHVVIPLAIVAVGTTTFAVFAAAGALRSLFEFGVYCFPLALAAAVLARDLVDRPPNRGAR